MADDAHDEQAATIAPGAAVPLAPAADPRPARILMAASYVVGGIGVLLGLWWIASNPTASAYAAAAIGVGGTGIISFVRHSILHRSDAARMGWDYGRRNDFQIEVGFANLAIGLVGLGAWALDWGVTAAGAAVVAYGLYIAGSAILHLTELGRPAAEGGGRVGAVVNTAIFATALLVVGVAAVSG
jgi:hypothetical protein